MLTVTSSSHYTGVVQPDGRFTLYENYNISNGTTMVFSTLIDSSIDIDTLVSLRTAQINETFAEREALAGIVTTGEIPISAQQFYDLMPINVRTALRAKAKTDAVLDDMLEFLKSGGWVWKSHAEEKLSALVTAGSIQQSHKDLIMNKWTEVYG